jgi:hypothetical protein
MFLPFALRECVNLNTVLRSRGHQSVNGSLFAAHKRQKPPAGGPRGGSGISEREWWKASGFRLRTLHSSLNFTPILAQTLARWARNPPRYTQNARRRSGQRLRLIIRTAGSNPLGLQKSHSSGMFHFQGVDTDAAMGRTNLSIA